MMVRRRVTERRVEGGGGLWLYVEESGNPAGRPIVFFHGYSQNHLVWLKQTESDLAEEFRLIAVDLRGHGRSDKPQGVYGDSRLWAEDVAGVLRDLELAQPVLVGWSYSGLVLCDYVRHYGQEAIGGLVFVGAVTRTGVKESFADLGDEFVALVRPSFSNVVTESQSAMEQLIHLTMKGLLSEEEFYLFLGFNGAVPPHVREGMMKRKLSNDDLLPTIQNPVLIVHGSEDRVVLPAAAERHAGMIPKARLRIYPGAGHSPFWENPGRFNEELREFVRSI
ncbi:alpha/beta fold hydrolase [Kyrpidia spormannii]|nr:alpha/beta hydrolase [Kyrpidia spormannii]